MATSKQLAGPASPRSVEGAVTARVPDGTT